MNLLTLKNKVNMKKILGLLMLFVSLHVFAETANVAVQKEETIDVRLNKGKVTNDDTYPRTFIPFSCVYADGMVQLSLLGDVGEYILAVTNQMTGERWSVSNTPVLQASTASGIYWVEIETEDGSMYYGTYTL